MFKSLFTWRVQLEELQSERTRYLTRRTEILEAAATVFADAVEEFADIAAVKRTLEDWKLRWVFR